MNLLYLIKIGNVGTNLTISGKGFSLNKDENLVRIGLKGKSLSIDYEAIQNWADCIILESSDSQIICSLQATEASVRSVKVYVKNKGLAVGTATFNFTLAVLSFTPTSSGYGGTRMFVSG